MKPAEVINLHLKKFSSSYDEAKGFGEKNLHAFRLRMKRLKAFIALLHEDGHHHLKIPPKLNALYACTGAIRNLQLQKRRILHFCAEENGRPDGYLELLRAEEEQWKQKALHLVNTVPIAEELAKRTSPVSGHIKKRAAKKFLRAEAAKLWALLLSNKISDEDLHRLRKVLKNILYNWKYAGAHASYFLPLCWQHKDGVRLFTEILGAFHDLCVSLELLHAFWERTDESERKLLQQMKKQWEKDKEKQTQSICAMLAAIKNESRQLEERKHLAGHYHPGLALN